MSRPLSGRDIKMLIGLFSTATSFNVKKGVIMVMIVWQLDLQLPVQSVPITTKVVSSNSAHGKVYSMSHYLIKFVSDLRQVSDFFRVLRFPPP